MPEPVHYATVTLIPTWRTVREGEKTREPKAIPSRVRHKKSILGSFFLPDGNDLEKGLVSPYLEMSKLGGRRAV